MKSRVKAKSRGKRKAVGRAKSKAKSKAKAKSQASRKSARPRAKAAPAAKSAKSAKPKSPNLEPLDQWIVAAAAELGLRVEKSWMPAVRTNLRVTLDQATAVSDFPLPDDAEPAPVFRA